MSERKFGEVEREKGDFIQVKLKKSIFWLLMKENTKVSFWFNIKWFKNCIRNVMIHLLSCPLNPFSKTFCAFFSFIEKYGSLCTLVMPHQIWKIEKAVSDKLKSGISFAAISKCPSYFFLYIQFFIEIISFSW